VQSAATLKQAKVPGQWAAIIEYDDDDEQYAFRGQLDKTTSTQAEFTALIKALQQIPGGWTVDAYFDCRSMMRAFQDPYPGKPITGADGKYIKLLKAELERLIVTPHLIGPDDEQPKQHKECHKLARKRKWNRRKFRYKGNLWEDKSIDRLMRPGFERKA
jgi:ribonuclease HI